MHPVTFVALRFSLSFPAARFKILQWQSLLFLFQHLPAALGSSPWGWDTHKQHPTNTAGALVFLGRITGMKPLPPPPDGEETEESGRVSFIKETKAEAGSSPKPLHRDVHLLNFWVTAYQTLGKNLQGPAQGPAPPHTALSLSFIHSSPAQIYQNLNSHSNNGCFLLMSFLSSGFDDFQAHQNTPVVICFMGHRSEFTFANNPKMTYREINE